MVLAANSGDRMWLEASAGFVGLAFGRILTKWTARTTWTTWTAWTEWTTQPLLSTVQFCPFSPCYPLYAKPLRYSSTAPYKIGKN